MIPTMRLRWAVLERGTATNVNAGDSLIALMIRGRRQTTEPVVLQQYHAPDPQQNETEGEWRDVPVGDEK